jgi:hypothetical protein
MNAPAIRKTQQIARPLKVLVPLIQSELQQGNSAGQEHYTQAGRLMIEAKPQVGDRAWSSWVKKNFGLSRTTSYDYMRWARMADESGGTGLPSSMSEFTGHTDRDRERRQSSQQKAFRRVLRDVAADTFVQERQSRDDEIKLHRELAEELIDIGYRALATKLHPDRGGSKDAMARLNRVRDELKGIAQTRRYT